jgi:hypothetical protein
MKLGKMFNKPSQNFFGVISALLVVVFIAVLFRYNGTKSSIKDKMTNYQGSPYPSSQESVISGPSLDSSMNIASASSLQGGNFLQVGGNQPVACTGAKMDPSDLLPKDQNSEWASVNPASNDLKNMNLLTAGQLIGINTVGNSLRNANYQERSEPIIERTNIGPWNNSTIDADTFRRPLEIGNV